MHRTDLHADGLQGVVPAGPGDPVYSNIRDGTIRPPVIKPVGVCIVTVVVPEGPQVQFGTVAGRGGVLVSVEGGKILSVVISQRISYRNTRLQSQCYHS